MSDSTSRVLGASAFITVHGTEYRLAPISMALLAEMEREALRAYKRQYLQTYLDVADSLPAGKIDQLLEDVAKWDTGQLPSRKAHSCKEVEITPEITDKLVALYGEIVRKLMPQTFRALLTTALDEERITVDEVEKATGTAPRLGWIPYDMWWTSGTHEGRLLFVWASLQEHHKLSKAEINKWPPISIVEAGKLVEQITVPEVGNT